MHVGMVQFSRQPRLDGKLRDQAALLAFCAKVPDLVREFDAVTFFAGVLPSFSGLTSGAFSSCWSRDVHYMVTAHRYLHALTGETDGGGRDLEATRVTDAAAATLSSLLSRIEGPGEADPNLVCAAGFAVHLLGDSYSHRQLAKPRRMYSPGLGHFRDNHTPDRILSPAADGTNRSVLYLEFVRKLGDILKIRLDQKQWSALEEVVKKNLNNSQFHQTEMRADLRKILKLSQ